LIAQHTIAASQILFAIHRRKGDVTSREQRRAILAVASGIVMAVGIADNCRQAQGEWGSRFVADDDFYPGVARRRVCNRHTQPAARFKSRRSKRKSLQIVRRSE